MKALSIKNPFAMLIIEGLKTIEVRKKPTNFRGTIYVHVSKKASELNVIVPGTNTEDVCKSQLGNVIGTVEIVDCRPLTREDLEAACLPYMFEGQYAWVLANPQKIAPFPVKGQLGLFNVNAAPGNI